MTNPQPRRNPSRLTRFAGPYDDGPESGDDSTAKTVPVKPRAHPVKPRASMPSTGKYGWPAGALIFLVGTLIGIGAGVMISYIGVAVSGFQVEPPTTFSATADQHEPRIWGAAAEPTTEILHKSLRERIPASAKLTDFIQYLGGVRGQGNKIWQAITETGTQDDLDIACDEQSRSGADWPVCVNQEVRGGSDWAMDRVLLPKLLKEADYRLDKLPDLALDRPFKDCYFKYHNAGRAGTQQGESISFESLQMVEQNMTSPRVSCEKPAASKRRHIAYQHFD